MNLSRFGAITLSLVSFVTTAAYAVEQLPEKEEDIPVEYAQSHDYALSIGIHRLSSGVKVRFGNLGAIQPHFTVTTATDSVSRTYSNGTISLDAPTANEIAYGSTTARIPVDTAKHPNANAALNADGTYSSETTIDSSGVVHVYTTVNTNLVDSTQNVAKTGVETHRELAYNPNQARTWSYQTPDQIDSVNHTVAMSDFGTRSEGASASTESRSSTGFSVQLERKLGSLGKRLEWGFSAGLDMTDINAATSGTVMATVMRTTDTYNLVNTGHNAAYNSPATTQPGDSQNIPFIDPTTGLPFTQTQSMDTSVTPSVPVIYSYTVGGDLSGATPLDVNRASTGVSTSTGISAPVRGFWQIKGAYYLMRLGPTFRYRFNDRWAMSGSVGAAVGYLGTEFRVNEVIDDSTTLALLGTTTQITGEEKNHTSKFIPGYYGTLNVEYWVTERTGFYFGLDHQQMGHYTQNPLAGRTATIDLGSSSGWRLGIITRF